jgi:hypothetical protein
MALQKIVNKQLAVGMEGEFFDNSPKRVRTFAVFGTAAAKATGTLTTTGNFSASDTVTIGVQTYKFVASLTTSPAAVPYEVLLGNSAAASLTNLEKAVNGTGTAGTDYGEGTLANALATAVATDSTLVVTAKAEGVDGNSIATAESSSAASFAAETLTGGTAEAPAKIARAFTYTDVEGKAVIGGTGVFAGIAVNPKEYAMYNNFNASLVLPNGVAGQLCTFGHIFVRVTADISVGQAAFFSNTDGSIKGATAGTSVSGYTEIKNSKFVEVAVTAGKIAKLELGN